MTTEYITFSNKDNSRVNDILNVSILHTVSKNDKLPYVNKISSCEQNVSRLNELLTKQVAREQISAE